MAGDYLTTQQVAERITEQYRVPVRQWKIRRVFEDGHLPEPGKFGNKRMLRATDLPTIFNKLVELGWLKPFEEPAHA